MQRDREREDRNHEGYKDPCMAALIRKERNNYPRRKRRSLLSHERYERALRQIEKFGITLEEK